MRTTHDLARLLLAGVDVPLIIRPENNPEETHIVTEMKAGMVGDAENHEDDPSQPEDFHMADPQPCVILVTEWDDHKMHTT